MILDPSDYPGLKGSKGVGNLLRSPRSLRFAPSGPLLTQDPPASVAGPPAVAPRVPGAGPGEPGRGSALL